MFQNEETSIICYAASFYFDSEFPEIICLLLFFSDSNLVAIFFFSSKSSSPELSSEVIKDFLTLFSLSFSDLSEMSPSLLQGFSSLVKSSFLITSLSLETYLVLFISGLMLFKIELESFLSYNDTEFLSIGFFRLP